MDIRLDASMEEALERVSIWTSETLARPEDTMTEETTSNRTPDTDRSDGGIGRPGNTPRSSTSIDELGNLSRATSRNDGGPDCRNDPSFGSYSGSGSNSNSPLF